MRFLDKLEELKEYWETQMDKGEWVEEDVRKAINTEPLNMVEFTLVNAVHQYLVQQRYDQEIKVPSEIP